MHHFVTEMCTYVHISVSKCCIAGYGTDALWHLYHGSIMIIDDNINEASDDDNYGNDNNAASNEANDDFDNGDDGIQQWCCYWC